MVVESPFCVCWSSVYRGVLPRKIGLVGYWCFGSFYPRKFWGLVNADWLSYWNVDDGAAVQKERE